MGKTQGFNIASCSFGTLPITGCKRAEIHERSELVRIEGDNDKWPTALAETDGGVEWAVEFTSINAAEAAQTQMFGSPATLTLTADDGTHGVELWRSNGTFGGTAIVRDIFTGIPDAEPSDLTVVSDTLFFRAAEGWVGGAHGAELWKSDGTYTRARSWPATLSLALGFRFPTN